jgi:hypothetical protein
MHCPSNVSDKEETAQQHKYVKFSCYCSFNLPDNGAHSQEVVINGAPALLVAVGSKPTDEQHHENEDLQNIINSL